MHSLLGRKLTQTLVVHCSLVMQSETPVNNFPFMTNFFISHWFDTQITITVWDRAGLTDRYANIAEADCCPPELTMPALPSLCWFCEHFEWLSNKQTMCYNSCKTFVLQFTRHTCQFYLMRSNMVADRMEASIVQNK